MSSAGSVCVLNFSLLYQYKSTHTDAKDAAQFTCFTSTKVPILTQQELARRYYEQKRREQLAKSGGERDSKGFPIQQAPGGQRFTGGGFSLSTG
jgi:hypothetical protein